MHSEYYGKYTVHFEIRTYDRCMGLKVALIMQLHTKTIFPLNICIYLIYTIPPFVSMNLTLPLFVLFYYILVPFSFFLDTIWAENIS